ncbi:MAG: hypothetical protein ABH800_01165 [Candidatus Nealsonbacteria bacterium]
MKKLGELLNSEEKFNIFTAEATNAFLTKYENGEKVLFVKLNENTKVITNGKERKEHLKSAKPWTAKKLESWTNSSEIGTVRIASSDNPLEIIAGDACLILEIENHQYIVSTYRDIYPKGWLIPGGLPVNLKELLNPAAVAIREVSEEILIGDTSENLYSLGDQKNVINLWGFNSRYIMPLDIEYVLPQNTGDAQTIHIETPKEEKTIKNVIFIDPEIASVALTIYLKVKLPIKLDELMLFDGETHWERPDFPLNRPVRITPLGKNSPVAVFSRGQNILSADWITKKSKEQTCKEEP